MNNTNKFKCTGAIEAGYSVKVQVSRTGATKEEALENLLGMIISKTQLDLIRRSTDEILLNKYDYYNSMPVRTLTALLNLKAIKQELDRRSLLDFKVNEDQYEMEAASL
jgi:hypothetical protein